MKVKPARPGLIIRDPETGRPIPDEGKTVKWSSFWARRKLDGDIVLVSDEPLKNTSKKKEKSKNIEVQQEIESLNVQNIKEHDL